MTGSVPSPSGIEPVGEAGHCGPVVLWVTIPIRCSVRNPDEGQEHIDASKKGNVAGRQRFGNGAQFAITVR